MNNYNQDIANMAEAFEAAVYVGDMNAPAMFAKPYRDLRSDCNFRPTIATTISESLDYTSGPELSEVFAMLVKVAKAGDLDAQKLITRMAETYAYHNVDTDDVEAHYEDNRSDEVEVYA